MVHQDQSGEFGEYSIVAEIYPLRGRRIWVAGHGGMVGSAMVRRLGREDCEILTVNRAEVDLRRLDQLEPWFAVHRPDTVVLAAATVGGIHANSARPADFIHDNLAIAINVLHCAHGFGVSKLVLLGSSCIYPRLAPQPMTEDALLTGLLEPTNEYYALAKIAGIKACDAYRLQHGCDFISAMPTNLFGAGDNYHPMDSHVVAALIRRLHLAKTAKAPTVEIWGSGKPLREFLFVDDLADGLVFLLKTHSGLGHVNIGTGKGTTILELAESVARVVGYEGRFVFDTSKPDGMPAKVMDVSRLSAMGWTASTSLHDGLSVAYDWFSSHQADEG